MGCIIFSPLLFFFKLNLRKRGRIYAKKTSNVETHAESLEKFYLNYAYRASRAAVLTIRIVAMCNVLLPFGIISIADFLNFVNNLTINSFELYTCTNLRFKIVNIAQIYLLAEVSSSFCSSACSFCSEASFFFLLRSIYLLPKMMPRTEMIAVITKTTIARI